MKKIYTKSVFEFNPKTGQYEVNHAESEFHFVADDAPMSQMKGGGGGGGGTTTTVTKSDPWAAQQPYLTRGFQEIQNAFLNAPAPQFYPGETVAGFSPETEQAQRGILNAAGDRTLSTDTSSMLDKTVRGDYLNEALNSPTGNMLNQTIRGDYLTGGTGFNAALDAAKNQIIPQVQSQFAARGRTGSGLAQQAEASAIGDKFAGLYDQERARQLSAGQQYSDIFNQGRASQLAAAQLAPTIDQMKYSDLARIADVGAQKEKLNQSRITEDMQRYDFNQNARRNAILQYMQGIQGNYGSTASTMTPEAGLTGWGRFLTGAGGGALMGLPLGPWGAAAGAGLGLLGAL